MGRVAQGRRAERTFGRADDPPRAVFFHELVDFLKSAVHRELFPGLAGHTSQGSGACTLVDLNRNRFLLGFFSLGHSDFQNTLLERGLDFSSLHLTGQIHAP